MAAPPHIARENGKKGGRPKGSKSWMTVAKEKAREHYLTRLENEFDEIVDIQFQEAKLPKNIDERKFVVSQFVGKPKDTVEISGRDGGAIETKNPQLEALIASAAAEKLKDAKT